ncbi:thioesterase domain-containing protein [Micromonosporaceae bacterium Da 78-11]
MTTGPDARVVLPLRRGGTEPPLICIHPGSGFGLPYLELLPYVGNDVPVVAFQARGLMGPAEPPADLDELVTDYLGQVRAVQPTGPYRLLGWCIGGRAAFEIACRLRDAGAEVELLALVSILPPVPEVPLTDEQILRDMLRPPGTGVIDAELDALCRLPLDYPALSAYLRRTGHPMRRLSEATMGAVLRTYQISDRLNRTPVTRTFDGDALVIAPRPGGPPEFTSESWRPHVTGGIDFRRIDARHGEMLDPGPARTIGALIDDRLHGAAVRLEHTEGADNGTADRG